MLRLLTSVDHGAGLAGGHGSAGVGASQAAFGVRVDVGIPDTGGWFGRLTGPVNDVVADRPQRPSRPQSSWPGCSGSPALNSPTLDAK
jgi:hypothetical protein